jgi:filamentous hemagglutinin
VEIGTSHARRSNSRAHGSKSSQIFPVIDKFEDGIVTSIKSIDLQSKSYRDPAAITRLGQGFVDKVAGFKEGRRAKYIIAESQIEGRALDLVVPPGATSGQQQALEGLKSYGTAKGVNVRIVEIER